MRFMGHQEPSQKSILMVEKHSVFAHSANFLSEYIGGTTPELSKKSK
jgi:hypothetical protein